MLQAVGLSFTVEPARVDEGAVKDAMRAEDPEGRETARALASLKACRVSAGAPVPSSSAPTNSSSAAMNGSTSRWMWRTRGGS